MNLVLLPTAEHDLLNGIDWFDQISIGLGDRFESEFYACLERIQDNPQQFAANSAGYRAVRLKRFTAVTFFRIDGDSCVIVRLLINGREDLSLGKSK